MQVAHVQQESTGSCLESVFSSRVGRSLTTVMQVVTVFPLNTAAAFDCVPFPSESLVIFLKYNLYHVILLLSNLQRLSIVLGVESKIRDPARSGSCLSLPHLRRDCLRTFALVLSFVCGSSSSSDNFQFICQISAEEIPSLTS